jgi:tetratricopeptide (TPR) repeat protein
LGNLGTIARLQGHLAEAESYQRQALALTRAIGHKGGEAQDLANLALVWRDAGKLAAALAQQSEALALAATLDQPELLWRICAGRAESYRRLGDPQSASEDLKAAVAGIEQVRGRLQRDIEKLTFFGEDKGAIYSGLVLLLHRELQEEAEALDYVERARSRLFLDILERAGLRDAQESSLGRPLGFQELTSLLG